MSVKPIRVLVCRVGQTPVVELLQPNERGHLDAMQAIVGGFIECVTLDDGIDVWLNEDGIALGLIPNRTFPTVGREVPSGFEGAFEIDMTDGGRPKPGEPAAWHILGDFFMARSRDGELSDLADADVEKYTARFRAEDNAAVRAALSNPGRPCERT